MLACESAYAVWGGGGGGGGGFKVLETCIVPRSTLPSLDTSASIGVHEMRGGLLHRADATDPHGVAPVVGGGAGSHQLLFGGYRSSRQPAAVMVPFPRILRANFFDNFISYFIVCDQCTQNQSIYVLQAEEVKTLVVAGPTARRHGKQHLQRTGGSC